MPEDDSLPALPPLDDDGDEDESSEEDELDPEVDGDRSDEEADDLFADDDVDAMPKESAEDEREIDDGADDLELGGDDGDDGFEADFGRDDDLAAQDDGRDDGGALGTGEDPADVLEEMQSDVDDDDDERFLFVTTTSTPLPPWSDAAWLTTTIVPEGQRVIGARPIGSRVLVATDDAIRFDRELARARTDEDEVVVDVAFEDDRFFALTDAPRVLSDDRSQALATTAKRLVSAGDVRFTLDERGHLRALDRDEAIATNVVAITIDRADVVALFEGGVVRRFRGRACVSVRSLALPDDAVLDGATIAANGDALAVAIPSFGVVVAWSADAAAVVPLTEGACAIALGADAAFASLARGARSYVVRIPRSSGDARVIAEVAGAASVLVAEGASLLVGGRGLARLTTP